MNRALILSLLVLTGCTQATASRIDARTFRIDDPGVPGGSSTPDRRVAERLCPKGYRVLSEESHKGGPDRAVDDPTTTTVWTIHCV